LLIKSITKSALKGAFFQTVTEGKLNTNHLVSSHLTVLAAVEAPFKYNEAVAQFKAPLKVLSVPV
jgi:hypothetical protein